jgi:nucleoside-diphosphate-sugar epimerase
VRSEAKIDAIRATASIKALETDSNLKFFIVPDIVKEGAFDQAIKGAEYVIHVASPIPATAPDTDYDRSLIGPAYRATISMLNSAERAGTVKRVVITSSGVATMTLEDMMSPNDHVYTDADRIPFPEGPYPFAFAAYQASKHKAFTGTWEYIAEHKPSFDVILIGPGYVLGANELVTDPAEVVSGSNGVAIAQVLGFKNKIPNPGVAVHLEDVAEIHVLALDPKIPGNQYFLATIMVNYPDAIDIVNKRFPKEVASGLLPNNGFQPCGKLLADGSRTEKVFGIKYRSYEEQIVSVTQQYIDLVAKTGKVPKSFPLEKMAVAGDFE